MNYHFAHNSIFIEKFIEHQEEFCPNSENIYLIHIDSNIGFQISSKIFNKENVHIEDAYFQNIKFSPKDKIYLHYLSKRNLAIAAKYKEMTSYWLFWGGEVYGLPYFDYDFFLPKTKNFILQNQKWFERIKLNIEKKIGNKLRLTFNYGFTSDIKNIDYFSHFLPQEYHLIKRQFPNFRANYLSWNYLFHKIKETNNKEFTLIGQSAAETNNHVDIFFKLNNELLKENLFVPLTYPNNIDYIEFVEKSFNSFSFKGKIQKKHLPLNEYEKFLSKVKFAIFGFKRNQGVGNIIELILNGTIVFLHHDNPFYDYLKSLGVDIFKIEEFIIRNELVIDFKKNQNIVLGIFGKEAVKEKYKRLLS